MISDESMEEESKKEDQVVLKEFNDNYITVKGVLARKNFEYLLFDEEEIPQFTQFTKVNFKQKLVISYEFDF